LKLCNIYIGKERGGFIVHSKAIAATSQHLYALVNNDMRESDTGSVEYVDMEPQDFARYAEYAYRYDYSARPWVLYDSVVEDQVQDHVVAGVEELSPEPAMLNDSEPQHNSAPE
jgi:hypothetical protein